MNFESMIGLGVAGNFTGHLEQAGESSDFVNVEVKEQNAPKGLFPFYIPSKTGSFIETYPLSSTSINPPKDGGNLQIEPEVALICNIEYDDNNLVTKINPLQFSAYNDCSIRKPNAKKISEKKNWGINSKGLSEQLIDIDNFSTGGIMDSYRIACYLLRDNQLHTYGVNSSINGYSHFYQKLLNWTVDKMNNQKDQGPLESIKDHLKQSNYPKQLIISVGATRYTDFGEKTFLKLYDESFIIIYDSNKYTTNNIEEFIKTKNFPTENISVLHQIVK